MNHHVKAKKARECGLRVARTQLNGGAVTALDGEGVNWGDWSLSRRQLDTRAVNDLREVSQGPYFVAFTIRNLLRHYAKWAMGI